MFEELDGAGGAEARLAAGRLELRAGEGCARLHEGEAVGEEADVELEAGAALQQRERRGGRSEADGALDERGRRAARLGKDVPRGAGA